MSAEEAAGFRIVIPARFASARFPGKPLALLAGKPMLQWVYERACAAGARAVVIATDDERIAVAAQGFGAPVAMTSARHPSGTDRIAEVAAQGGWGARDIVVNVQGDEPLMPPALMRQVAALLQRRAGADIATLCTPVPTLAEFLDPNVVKVVADDAGRALYFSRAPIPWHRDEAALSGGAQGSFAGSNRHLGIYAYRVEALARLTTLPVHALEHAEKLEQLRALAHGLEIRVERASVLPGQDVNTPADLERAARAVASNE